MYVMAAIDFIQELVKCRINNKKKRVSHFGNVLAFCVSYRVDIWPEHHNSLIMGVS